jgi:hypothetical protein
VHIATEKVPFIEDRYRVCLLRATAVCSAPPWFEIRRKGRRRDTEVREHHDRRTPAAGQFTDERPVERAAVAKAG